MLAASTAAIDAVMCPPDSHWPVDTTVSSVNHRHVDDALDRRNPIGIVSSLDYEATRAAHHPE
jgi:hypothetical protein